MYDPSQELDPVTHAAWSRMSLKELENLRNELMNRIDKMTQFSESLHNDAGEQYEKLERYIMWRKNDKTGSNDIIL